MSWRIGCCSFLWLLGITAASGHALAPALLQLRETQPAQYEVLWRTATARAPGAALQPQLPADCAAQGEPLATLENRQSLALRWSVRCQAALPGQIVGVAGLNTGETHVILRIEALDGSVTQGLLGPQNTEFRVPTALEAEPVWQRYMVMGFEHLLSGLDHMLFVLGLFLLVPGWRPLLITITAFTLGHSVTLALASLGLIKVPQALTELCIALSILWLAVEIARPASASPSLLRRRPWLMASGFGLLHGLGFAGALAEAGLPQEGIVQALLAFNIGIELGQLLWVLALLMVAKAGQKMLKNPSETMARVLPAYVIGVLAAYWCWQRLAELWA